MPCINEGGMRPNLNAALNTAQRNFGIDLMP